MAENSKEIQKINPPNIKKINYSFKACSKFLIAQGGFLKNLTRGGKLDLLERDSIDVLTNNKT